METEITFKYERSKSDSQVLSELFETMFRFGISVDYMSLMDAIFWAEIIKGKIGEDK